MLTHYISTSFMIHTRQCVMHTSSSNILHSPLFQSIKRIMRRTFKPSVHFMKALSIELRNTEEAIAKLNGAKRNKAFSMFHYRHYSFRFLLKFSDFSLCHRLLSGAKQFKATVQKI